MEQQARIDRKEAQETIEKQRVISFLNVLFGNHDSTLSLWKQVNNYSQNHFGVKIWENDFKDVNIPYLLQALQTNLRIVLAPTIHQRTLFKSMQSFQLNDF